MCKWRWKQRQCGGSSLAKCSDCGSGGGDGGDGGKYCGAHDFKGLL